MGQEINLLSHFPTPKRAVEERGKLLTDEIRTAARKFAVEYFDGDRLTGYGGFTYQPRFWQQTVRDIRDHYNLPPDAAILDVGCAKGFMLYDFKQMSPELNVTGVDTSEYALERAHPEIRQYLQLASATDLPFADGSFDLALSIKVIHNLALDDCKQALREIQRVSGGRAFIVVDAWRNDRERENLEKWNLTALTYMHVDDWRKLFDEVGYTGDYYWFIVE